jgi:hypothetical protein
VGEFGKEEIETTHHLVHLAAFGTVSTRESRESSLAAHDGDGAAPVSYRSRKYIVAHQICGVSEPALRTGLRALMPTISRVFNSGFHEIDFRRTGSGRRG